MLHPFRERFQSGPVILADGAMGTQLYARGVAFDQCFDAQNLVRPELVEGIHRDYINAGAQLVETNTFGANRIKLATHGLEDAVREINRRGVRLARAAREICGEPVFVAGSVGPTGRALEPFGSMSTEELFAVYHEQIAAMLEGGVDLLILETFGDLLEIAQAVRAAQELTDLPIVAQMTFADDLRTPHGHSPEQVVHTLAALNVDVIGGNCSVGSNALLELTQRLVAAGAPYVSAMPNAGWPAHLANRVLYLSSPEYMADYARQMVAAGAILVGGCCGTTPQHIRALKHALDAKTETPEQVQTIEVADSETETSLAIEPSTLAGKLGWKRVISVEISPPRGANPRKALQGARLLRDAGVDAVNVFDSAMARVRMSSMSTAVMIKQQVGVEAIVHFTTRDRNLMAIQSDLIGGHALGIRTILALTGDPPSIGNYAQSKAVYDIDSVGLIRIIKQLNQGVDVGGNSIGTPTRFLVGCGLNPTAEDLDWELDHLRKKLDAGADFIMTQPVYDAGLFKRVLAELSPLEVPVLMGVLPLQSERHALFLH
ncbi:MAG: bifunctional homocysteine S-methyltransferase/methylenetetrahydrofolate reductase, partial [Chloroflexota bacterium]